MKQAVKSIWGQAMAEDMKLFRWFFIPSLFLVAIGLVILVISFGYLDWLIYKRMWSMELIVVPFEIAVLGFFHAMLILWGADN